MAAENASAIEQAYRAGKASRDDNEARRHYQRGIDLARQELSAKPDSPDATSKGRP